MFVSSRLIDAITHPADFVRRVRLPIINWEGPIEVAAPINTRRAGMNRRRTSSVNDRINDYDKCDRAGCAGDSSANRLNYFNMRQVSVAFKILRINDARMRGKK